MKLIPTLVAAFGLIIGIATALPQTGSGSGDEFTCPDAPCYNVSVIAEYCVNATSEAIVTGDAFDSTDPVDCVCTPDAVIEGADGFTAAGVCLVCNETLTTALQDLLARWVYTCYTDLQDGPDQAVECWNSDLEQGCDQLPGSKAKTLRLREKAKKTKTKKTKRRANTLLL